LLLPLETHEEGRQSTTVCHTRHSRRDSVVIILVTAVLGSITESNAAVEWLILLFRILVVPGSNLGKEPGCPH
jgi:hypothetical protein